MTNVVQFPRAAVIVPLFDESRRFSREIDRRHALRWYALGARVGCDLGLRRYAIQDGINYLRAYEAGWIARTFGVCLLECVS